MGKQVNNYLKESMKTDYIKKKLERIIHEKPDTSSQFVLVKLCDKDLV